jgi:cytochrome c peroxidase
LNSQATKAVREARGLHEKRQRSLCCATSTWAQLESAMRRFGGVVGPLGVLLLSFLADPVVQAGQEPLVSVPAPASMPAARIAIGERLFADNRLSRDRTHACTTCHPLDRAGVDGLRAAPRPTAGPPLRNTPTIFNAALNASLNWDGVTTKLDDHADRVITGLMGLTWPELLSRLENDRTYVTAFRTAYDGGLTRTTVLDAIVAFERTLVTPNARFDRFLGGDTGALSAREREGYRRFKSYGCASCHQGVNIGGNLYERFGVFEPAALTAERNGDPGRLRVTNVARDEGVFRVPSLRNVAVTAPYFHDGRASTLDDAVKVMGRHQLGRILDPLDTQLLVDFLKTLTGEYRGRPLAGARHDEPKETKR